jgi:hypothetical protein
VRIVRLPATHGGACALLERLREESDAAADPTDTAEAADPA